MHEPRVGRRSNQATGAAAEQEALSFLQLQGLQLLACNYRTPGRGGGEIDLIMRAPDATVVFVEVRKRSGSEHGGAGASIGAVKRRRIVRAAQHYLLSWPRLPAVRFDVVLFEVDGLHWLPGAFDAGD